MADWNSLLSNAASHDYSRLPTQSPSEDSCQTRPSRLSGKRSVDFAEYSSSRRLESHISPDDEFLQERRPSRASRQSASLGQRVSHTGVVIDDPLLSPGRTGSRPEALQQPGTEAMGRTRTEALVNNPNSCWRFVERSWFQAISALVIISNVITTIVEMDKPYTKSMFFISDQVMLVFYLIELFSRANYFGNLFLCGPARLVGWNVLDIIVVVAGVLDQWLMPILPGDTNGGVVSKILNLLRLLRLLRVFKIVRVFLDIDLSWTEAPAFQSFIGLVILVNSLLMGLEIDIAWWGWFYFEQVLLVVYVFELSVRLKNFGKYFFSCANADIVWNMLDFIIVGSSVLDSWLTPLCGVIMKSLSGHKASHKKEEGMSLGKVMMLMRMLRLMRILRLAKLVKSIQPLFILVTGVMAALQGVSWVLVLTIVTLYAMGILATSLIGKKMGFPPGAEVPEEILKPFSTVPSSMFTLFRVMSGAASDAESVAIDDLMDNLPALKLGFVFFMITSSWTLLSILTAVVSDNMISTTGQQEEEIKIQNAEEDRMEHVERLTELFNKIDVGGDGQVERSEIEHFLSDRDNALLTARRCRVPVRDVREVLQTVAEACEGSTVSIATFVEHLADVSNVVTEKSVMKIEAMLTNLTRCQTEYFKKLFDVLGKPNFDGLSELEIPSEAGSETLPKNAEAVNKGQSELEKRSEAGSETLPKKTEAVNKGQLEDVERLMQTLVERTEASVRENNEKTQRLVERVTEALEHRRVTEALELQLCKMQNHFLCSMRDQSSDVLKARDSGAAAHPAMNLKSDQELSQKQKPSSLEVAIAVGEKQTDVPKQLSAAHIEARLRATEECVNGLHQKTESMLMKIEGPLERMSTAVDKGLSSLAVVNFSATLESELRMIRQELLLCPGRQNLDISRANQATEGDKQVPPVMEIQRDLAGVPGSSIFHMEAVAPRMQEDRLLATEKSMYGLHEKTEAKLRKIEGLLEKAVDNGHSALSLDKFSETLERELRMMRQELLCSTRVSLVKDTLLSPKRSKEQEAPCTPKASLSRGSSWSPQLATAKRQE